MIPNIFQVSWNIVLTSNIESTATINKHMFHCQLLNFSHKLGLLRGGISLIESRECPRWKRKKIFDESTSLRMTNQALLVLSFILFGGHGLPILFSLYFHVGSYVNFEVIFAKLMCEWFGRLRLNELLPAKVLLSE